MPKNEFDVVIIGSGFGGSVSALRLIEKGYSVAVLEAGRRFKDKDFPKTSWRINKFLFFPFWRASMVIEVSAASKFRRQSATVRQKRRRGHYSRNSTHFFARGIRAPSPRQS